MGYDIHIEREPSITLEEWTAAIETTDGVRIDNSDICYTIPKTGKVLKIGGKPGNACLYFKGTWVPCFRWQDGSIAFKAVDEFMDPDSDFRKLARTLAKKLNARLCGDEGEEYD